MKKGIWVKTNDCKPFEADNCEYGFICWVDGMVEMVGTDDGISWDESRYFMPLYELSTPESPKKYKRVNEKVNIGSTGCNVL